MRARAWRRTTPEEGGETVFPLAENKVSGPGWSECARGGAAVKTTKGDALLFYRCGLGGWVRVRVGVRVRVKVPACVSV